MGRVGPLGLLEAPLGACWALLGLFFGALLGPCGHPSPNSMHRVGPLGFLEVPRLLAPEGPSLWVELGLWASLRLPWGPAGPSSGSSSGPYWALVATRAFLMFSSGFLELSRPAWS
eukprot:793711-Pyramimonas_sp.AAC.1